MLRPTDVFVRKRSDAKGFYLRESEAAAVTTQS
ncbi:hypothetical protein ACVWXS_003594 [Lysinibacillus sp. TE18511]